MTEIIQILFFIFIFTILLISPFNIFIKSTLNNKISLLEKSTLNFLINLNYLLFLSFLNIKLSTIQPIVIILYILNIIFIYRKNFNLLPKFLFSLFPLFLVFFVISIEISSSLNLGWDAKFFYYIKALFFYEQKTIFDLNQFSNNFWHPHYGSYLWSFFWSLSFIKFEFFGRLFYVFLFCYILFYILQINKSQKINNIIFLLIVLIFYEYEFFIGLQEILIFSLLVLISRKFYSLTRKYDLIDLITIILSANLLIWIKSEGIVYFLIILLLLIFIPNKFSLKNKLILILIFTLLYFVKFSIYEIYELNFNGQKTFYNLEYVLELNFEIIINKLKYIIIWFIYYVLNNIFFVLFLIIIFYEKFYNKLYFKYNEYNLILLYYMISILMFIFFAYAFRDMEIIYSIRTTMDRIIMSSSGFLVFPCILKLNYLFLSRK
jgi:hypothetical protein